MGARLSTVFENRSSVEMEIRVFITPARPDKYIGIIRIEPGESREVLTEALYVDPQNPTYLMVFMDGAYAGQFLLSKDVVGYAKISCDINDDGEVTTRGIKHNSPGFRKLRGFSCFRLGTN